MKPKSTVTKDLTARKFSRTPSIVSKDEPRKYEKEELRAMIQAQLAGLRQARAEEKLSTSASTLKTTTSSMDSALKTGKMECEEESQSSSSSDAVIDQVLELRQKLRRRFDSANAKADAATMSATKILGEHDRRKHAAELESLQSQLDEKENEISKLRMQLAISKEKEDCATESITSILEMRDNAIDNARAEKDKAIEDLRKEKEEVEANWRSRCNALQAQLEQTRTLSENTRTECDSERQKLTFQVDSLNNALSDAQTRIEQLQKSIAQSTQSAQAEQDKAISAMRLEKEEAEETWKSLCNALEAQLEETRIASSKNTRAAECDLEERQQLTSQVEMLNGALSEANSTIQQLTARIQNIEAEREQAIQAMRLEKEESEKTWKAQCTSLKEQLEESRTCSESARAEYDSERQQLNSKLESLQQALSDAETTIGQLQQESTTQIQSAKDENDKTTKAMRLEKIKYTALEAQLEKLRLSLETANAEHDLERHQLTAQVSSLDQALAQAQSRMDQLQQESAAQIQSAKDENDKAIQAMRVEKEEAVANCKAQCKSLSAQLEETREKMETVRAECDSERQQLTLQAEKLKIALSQATTDQQSRNNSVAEWQSANDEKERKLKVLKAENKALRTSLETSHSTIQSISSERTKAIQAAQNEKEAFVQKHCRQMAAVLKHCEELVVEKDKVIEALQQEQQQQKEAPVRESSLPQVGSWSRAAASRLVRRKSDKEDQSSSEGETAACALSLEDKLKKEAEELNAMILREMETQEEEEKVAGTVDTNDDMKEDEEFSTMVNQASTTIEATPPSPEEIGEVEKSSTPRFLFLARRKRQTNSNDLPIDQLPVTTSSSSLTNHVRMV